MIRKECGYKELCMVVNEYDLKLQMFLQNRGFECNDTVRDYYGKTMALVGESVYTSIDVKV